MSYEWQITIKVWPYFGRTQKECGEETRTFRVRCDDVHRAITAAENICKGIKTNPAVWETPITSIVQMQ